MVGYKNVQTSTFFVLLKQVIQVYMWIMKNANASIFNGALRLLDPTVRGWTPSGCMLVFIRTQSTWGPTDHSQTVTSRGNAGRTIFPFFPTEAQSPSPFHVCFWANNVLSQHNRPLILLYNKQAFRSGHMQELLIKMQQTTPSPPPCSHTCANITTRVHTLSHTNENILYSDFTLPQEQTANKQWSLEVWSSYYHNSLLHWRLLRSSAYLRMFFKPPLKCSNGISVSPYMFHYPAEDARCCFPSISCSPPL